MLAWI
jgi:hypothetical protein